MIQQRIPKHVTDLSICGTFYLRGLFVFHHPEFFKCGKMGHIESVCINQKMNTKC